MGTAQKSSKQTVLPFSLSMCSSDPSEAAVKATPHPLTCAASHEEVERMGRQCAICWGDMVVRTSRHARQPAGGEAGTPLAGQPAAAAGGAVDDADANAVQEAAAAAPAAAMAAAAAPAAAPAAAAPAAAAAAEAAGGGGGGGANAGLSAHGARSMALPCGHAFHRECLQQWLQQCYG